jgi:gluconate 2-dehydrogenase alpha chain
MAVQRKVDVVTIGAGWTAAILAWKLTAAGRQVVSLEQGPSRWTDPDFLHNHDHLRFQNRFAMMVNLARETWTWRPNTRLPSLPMRQYGSFHPGQGIGGAAIHWTAQLWRFLPQDFRYRSHHIERYGEQKLPPGNTIQDWPVSYQELEPYYDEFDYDIGSSGQTGNLNGTLIEGGNPFEGPRSRPYPLPPMPPNVPSLMFADAARQLGYHPFPYAAGIASQAYRDRFGNYRAGCILCGFCTRYGCEVDAKSSPQTTHIPPALRTGRYEIRPGCLVTRINIGPDGLASGVMYIDENGVEQEQPADVVIVSGFTLTNVRMLLLSRGGAHPNGIGNDRGMVGKNYTYQIFLSPVAGYFPGRRFNLYMGNGTTLYSMYDLYGDNFDHSDLDFMGGAMVYATTGERDPVNTATNVPIDGNKNWGQEWKDALREEWNSYADIGIEGESMAYAQNFLDLDPNFRGADGQPLLRLTFDWTDNERKLYKYVVGKMEEIMRQMGPARMEADDELGDYNIHQYQSTHPTGGAIMGTNPGNSVTNKYGQVWDTPNVFVTGAALFPQNPGANPTATVTALAYMAGDALCRDYFDNPGELLT